jgi:ATP-dependent Clp protease protease subunit
MNVYFGSKNPIVKNDDDDETEQHTEIYREHNHIFFYSEIDRKTISSLLKLIREAQEYCLITSFKLDTKIPIFLHISSLGGYINDALNAVDFIQSSQIPIFSIVEGNVASAATLISIVCKKRFIRPNAFIMIHQLNSEIGGKMNEITDEFENLSETMDILKKMYTNYTRFSNKQIDKILSHDLYLNADKSIKYGLVDNLRTLY